MVSNVGMAVALIFERVRERSPYTDRVLDEMQRFRW